MSNIQIFGKHHLNPGEHRFFTCEKFLLGTKREKEGWLILLAEQNSDENQGEPDINQGEYYQTGKSNTLRLLPALPEKPLVFKGSKLHVSPGQRLTFYLKIPLTIQVYFSKIQPENVLKEFPVKRLSDTWFGEPFSGESAFALGNEFFFSIEEMNMTPLDAICPVTIFNNSAGVLEVERLIIRVENLAIYKNENKMITSQLAIEYKGKDTISSANYHYAKAFHGEKAEIITKPRATASKHLLKINFHFIRNLYKQEL